MKTPNFPLMTCGLAVMTLPFLTSCVTSIDLVEAARGMAERTEGAKPESEWNAIGTWKKISDQPATYIRQSLRRPNEIHRT